VFERFYQGGVLVFGRNRRARTNAQQLIDELMESYGHLKTAAGHAADSAAERVVPSFDRARDLASRRVSTTRGSIAPLYQQMRDGAIRNGVVKMRSAKSRRRRWPMLVGLVAAGTAVGAVGAMMARRRQNAAQWDDFEPLPSIDDLNYGAGGPSQPPGKKMTSGAASMADTVADQAGKIADNLHDRSSRDNSRP
jgi:hypothetical protein